MSANNAFKGNSGVSESIMMLNYDNPINILNGVDNYQNTVNKIKHNGQLMV